MSRSTAGEKRDGLVKFFFFFQAEDGIRDLTVTGVQTCALPISQMQQVRMDRLNTYIKVSGAVGWACYQWDFQAVVDGQQMKSQGQTTVVLEKRNNHWVIVLNHTSVAPKPAQAVPASAPPEQQQPAKPAPR